MRARRKAPESIYKPIHHQYVLARDRIAKQITRCLSRGTLAITDGREDEGKTGPREALWAWFVQKLDIRERERLTSIKEERYLKLLYAMACREFHNGNELGIYIFTIPLLESNKRPSPEPPNDDNTNYDCLNRAQMKQFTNESRLSYQIVLTCREDAKRWKAGAMNPTQWEFHLDQKLLVPNKYNKTPAQDIIEQAALEYGFGRISLEQVSQREGAGGSIRTVDGGIKGYTLDGFVAHCFLAKINKGFLHWKRHRSSALPKTLVDNLGYDFASVSSFWDKLSLEKRLELLRSAKKKAADIMGKPLQRSSYFVQAFSINETCSRLHYFRVMPFADRHFARIEDNGEGNARTFFWLSLHQFCHDQLRNTAQCLKEQVLEIFSAHVKEELLQMEINEEKKFTDSHSKSKKAVKKLKRHKKKLHTEAKGVVSAVISSLVQIALKHAKDPTSTKPTYIPKPIPQCQRTSISQNPANTNSKLALARRPSYASLVKGGALSDTLPAPKAPRSLASEDKRYKIKRSDEASGKERRKRLNPNAKPFMAKRRPRAVSRGAGGKGAATVRKFGGLRWIMEFYASQAAGWRPEWVVQLSNEITGMTSDLRRLAEERRKMHALAVDALKLAVKSRWPGASVDVYGSFSTPLFLPSSDVDLVIGFPSINASTGGRVQSRGRREKGEMWEPRGSEEDQRRLDELGEYLGRLEWVKGVKTIRHAALPICKVNADLGEAGAVSLDISIASRDHRGLQTMNLINLWCREYPSLSTLVLLLKQLLVTNELNDAYTGGLSSYGLVVLVKDILRLDSLIKGMFKGGDLPGRNWERMFAQEQDLGRQILAFLELYGNHFDPTLHVVGLWLAPPPSHSPFPRINPKPVPPILNAAPKVKSKPNPLPLEKKTVQKDTKSGGAKKTQARTSRTHGGHKRGKAARAPNPKISAGIPGGVSIHPGIYRPPPLWIPDPIFPSGNLGKSCFAVRSVLATFKRGISCLQKAHSSSTDAKSRRRNSNPELFVEKDSLTLTLNRTSSENFTNRTRNSTSQTRGARVQNHNSGVLEAAGIEGKILGPVFGASRYSSVISYLRETFSTPLSALSSTLLSASPESQAGGLVRESSSPLINRLGEQIERVSETQNQLYNTKADLAELLWKHSPLLHTRRQALSHTYIRQALQTKLRTSQIVSVVLDYLPNCYLEYLSQITRESRECDERVKEIQALISTTWTKVKKPAGKAEKNKIYSDEKRKRVVV